MVLSWGGSLYICQKKGLEKSQSLSLLQKKILNLCEENFKSLKKILISVKKILNLSEENFNLCEENFQS